MDLWTLDELKSAVAQFAASQTPSEPVPNVAIVPIPQSEPQPKPEAATYDPLSHPAPQQSLVVLSPPRTSPEQGPHPSLQPESLIRPIARPRIEELPTKELGKTSLTDTKIRVRVKR